MTISYHANFKMASLTYYPCADHPPPPPINAHAHTVQYCVNRGPGFFPGLVNVTINSFHLLCLEDIKATIVKLPQSVILNFNFIVYLGIMTAASEKVSKR